LLLLKDNHLTLHQIHHHFTLCSETCVKGNAKGR